MRLVCIQNNIIMYLHCLCEIWELNFNHLAFPIANSFAPPKPPLYIPPAARNWCQLKYGGWAQSCYLGCSLVPRLFHVAKYKRTHEEGGGGERRVRGVRHGPFSAYEISRIRRLPVISSAVTDFLSDSLISRFPGFLC